MSEPITPPATPDDPKRNDLIFQPNLSPTPTQHIKPSVSKSTATSIKESVQVLVRCRPPSEKEKLERPCWYVRPEEGSIELLQIKNPTSGYSFHYDKVIEGVDNSQVYQAGIHELVRSAMKGYNGTVFAYGQTASGKTYTMMGTEEEPGVTPRAVEEVFSYINTDTTGREYMLRVSYMEIYNEKMKDLFNPIDGKPEIAEDKKHITVRNLKEHIVKSPQQVMELIKLGEKNRHVSATDYNEQSSRSHSIFQIVIESRSPHALTQVRLSQLNLIDLAGSEKVTSDMERRMEGSYINKSLLTLGNVISKLTSNDPVTHIPFRDSKLTRILQTALSGNARIAVICTINPTLASKDESLNTLRFAQRAKLVKTAAKMTSIMDKSELKKCLIRIAELQTQMREKTELEVATRESLKDLLGMILTGSKEEEEKGLLARLDNISTQDLATGDTTIRDVVVRCQEGFTAYKQYISQITSELESSRDRQHVMESIQNKQKDQLAQRDAQIDHLKQELNKKHLPTPSTSYSQKTRLSPKYVKAASDTISHAIAEAITSALHQSPNPDMAKAISTMVHAYFPSNLPVHELNQSFLDKTTISTSLQHVITKNMRPTITESVSFIPAHFYLPPVPDLVCTDDGGEWVDLKQDHLDIQGHQDKVSERDDSVSMKEEKDHAPIKDEEEDHASIKEEDHASIKEEEDDHLSMEQQDDDVSLEQEEEDRLSLEQEEEDRLSLEQEDDNASMKHKVDDVSITEEKENDLSLKEDRLSLKEEPSTPSPLQQENNKLTVVVESQQGVDACVQTVSIDYTEEISRAVDQLVEFALPSPDTESFDLTASSIQDEQEEPHVMRSIQQPAFLHINKWAMVCLLALIYSHYYF